MSKPLLLVLGDQLTLTLPTLCDAPSNAVVALCEVAGPVCGVGLPAAGKTFLLTGPAKHDGCRLPFFCPTPYPAGAVVGKALG